MDKAKKSVKWDVLLISPGSRTFYGEPRYPMGGISMVGAVLRERGNKVQALDMRFSSVNDEDFKSKLQAADVKVVGFTVTNWDVLEAVRLASIVKAYNPEIKTVFGGPQASLCPNETIAYNDVDVVVKGEGEGPIVALLEALENDLPLRDVAGLTFKDSDGKIIHTNPSQIIKDLSSLPWPAYDLFDLKRYFAFGERKMGITGSRGCPFGCTFCTSYSVMGKATRYRDPDDVLAEIKYWNETAQVTHFQFQEDNFLGSRSKARAFLDALEKNPLPITYALEVGVRADALTPEICQKLKKTGCAAVAIGVESSDPEVLKLVDKGEDIETITKGIRAAKEAGLFIKGYFIVGLPGDSKEKVKKSVEYARDEEIDLPRFALVQSFPHSKLTDWVEKMVTFIMILMNILSRIQMSFIVMFISTSPDFRKKKYGNPIFGHMTRQNLWHLSRP